MTRHVSGEQERGQRVHACEARGSGLEGQHFSEGSSSAEEGAAWISIICSSFA